MSTLKIGVRNSKRPGTVGEQTHKNRIPVRWPEETSVHRPGTHQQPADHISRRAHQVREALIPKVAFSVPRLKKKKKTTFFDFLIINRLMLKALKNNTRVIFKINVCIQY